MLKSFFIFSMFASLMGMFQTSVGMSATLTGNEVVKKADLMRFIETDVSFNVQVNDISGSKNQKTIYKVYSKGSEMSRVETIFPERQAGRRMLMTADNLWLFTPDIKRPTRISMQQRLTGEVANGDIARTHFGSDYEATLKSEVKIDGKDAYFLQLKKKKDDVTYSAIDYWVAKKNFAPIRAVFKTDGGKDLKSATYLEPKPFLGRPMISKIEIVNAINKNQKSILLFQNYKKEKLDDSFFNKESLSN